MDVFTRPDKSTTYTFRSVNRESSYVQTSNDPETAVKDLEFGALHAHDLEQTLPRKGVDLKKNVQYC